MTCPVVFLIPRQIDPCPRFRSREPFKVAELGQLCSRQPVSMKITAPDAGSLNLVGPHLFLSCGALAEHNLIHKLPSSRCVGWALLLRFESHSLWNLQHVGPKGAGGHGTVGISTPGGKEAGETGRAWGIGEDCRVPILCSLSW